MRILIPNHFPLQGSGSGIYTLNVAQELVRLGHEVLVIVPDHEPVPADRYPFPVRSILFNGGNQNLDTEVPFNFPCFTTHPKSNQTFYALNDSEMETYVELWRGHIGEAAASFSPDIVHGHHVWVAPFVATELGLPTVISVHGTDLMGFEKGPRYRKMALIAAEKAVGLIAISKQVMADTMDTYQVSRDKVHLIWNGFDSAIFRVLPDTSKDSVFTEFGLQPGEGQPPLVSFVGKFTDFKGIDVLLRAAAVYEKVLPGVQTVLVGQGQLWDEMHQLREELNLESVHFLGHQSQPMVARIYNAADVAVVPSRIEPFGLVAVEALACGTPVVATNEGGLPDFINSQVGALVPVDDHLALADAIVAEINANSKISKGQFASQYALSDFSWSGQVEKMVELFRNTLE